MLFKSVRFKFVFIYIIILTVTLSSFSLLIYGNFSKNLYGDLDDLLCSRAEGVVNAFNTYYQIKKIEAARQGKAIDLSATGGQDDFLKVAASWVETKFKDPDLMSIYVRIVDRGGHVIASSGSIPKIGQISSEDFKSVLDGDESYDTVDSDSADGKKIKYRLCSEPVKVDSSTLYVVQVAGPVSLLSIALSSLRFILFVLLPLTVLLAALPGILLVKIVLSPVDKMINTLKQITAENLKLKIHIPDTKDEVSRLAGTFNEMISRLDRSVQAQQDFMRSISHELAVPVDILRKDIDKAMHKARTPDEYKAAMENALKEIDVFSQTVADLRAITDLGDGRLLLEIKKVDLSSLVTEEAGAISVLAEEKDLDLSVYCKESVVIDADQKQLKRLFKNLLDNAIKYTNRKGRVVVTVSKEGDQARITVSDTGFGMPEDEIPYIFDRFYQIKKARRTRSGYGLGLSEAKVIVDAHKGKISAESKLGQGSTFIINLPISYPV